MNPIRSGLLGLAVGDALGVPVEFQRRQILKANPVTDMRGYGTYNQPPGTWSDDTSLACCLAETLAFDYSLRATASRFISWRNYAHWTAHEEVFDIGNTTNHAINQLETILQNRNLDALKDLHKGASDQTNGNGSLMRIFPLFAYVKDMEPREQFIATWESSALTHGHVRAGFACWLYLRLVQHLVSGIRPNEAYRMMQDDGKNHCEAFLKTPAEIATFDRILNQDISLLDEESIRSSGYVIHSLEASLWCFLRNETYSDTVLAAVNLGEDTDTTGAIVGALAGVYYGESSIPPEWLNVLAKREAITELGDKVWEKYG
mgnify:CR=1 FL=1